MQSKTVKLSASFINKNKSEQKIDFLIPEETRAKDVIAVLAAIFNVSSKTITITEYLRYKKDGLGGPKEMQESDKFLVGGEKTSYQYNTNTIKTNLDNPLENLSINGDGKYDLSERIGNHIANNKEQKQKNKKNYGNNNANNANNVTKNNIGDLSDTIPNGKQEKDDKNNNNILFNNQLSNDTNYSQIKEKHGQVVKQYTINNGQKIIKFIPDDRIINYQEALRIRNQYGEEIQYIYKYNAQNQHLECYRIHEKSQSCQKMNSYLLNSSFLKNYHLDKKIRFWNKARQLAKVKKKNRDEYTLALRDIEKSLPLLHTTAIIEVLKEIVCSNIVKENDDAFDKNQIEDEISAIKNEIKKLKNQNKKLSSESKRKKVTVIDNKNTINNNKKRLRSNKLTLEKLKKKYLTKRQEDLDNAWESAGINYKSDKSKDKRTQEERYKSATKDMSKKSYTDKAKIEYINLHGYCCQIIYSKENIKIDIKSKGDIIFHTTDGKAYTVYGRNKDNDLFRKKANADDNGKIHQLLPSNEDFKQGVTITIENDQHRAQALDIAQKYGSAASKPKSDLASQLSDENAKLNDQNKALERLIEDNEKTIQENKARMSILKNQCKDLSKPLNIYNINKKCSVRLQKLEKHENALKHTAFLVNTLNEKIGQKINSLQTARDAFEDSSDAYKALNGYIGALKKHHQDIKNCLKGDRYSGASFSQLENLYKLVSCQCKGNEFLQRSTDQRRITWYKSALKVCAALAVLATLTGLVLLTCGVALPVIGASAGAALTGLSTTAKVSIGISTGLVAGGLPVKTGKKCIDKLSNIAPGRVVIRHIPNLPPPCFFKKSKAITKRINHIHDVYDTHKKALNNDQINNLLKVDSIIS